MIKRTNYLKLILLTIFSFLMMLMIPNKIASHVKSAPSEENSEEVTAKVATYNIAAGTGIDGEYDLDRIAETIQETEAEIIGLQEVDVHWDERSNFDDMIKKLAEKLDMHYYFAPIYDEEPDEKDNPRRQYGLGVLSEYPIKEANNQEITRLSTQEEDPEPEMSPGFLEARIDVEGRDLWFYVTHLDYRGDPTVRQMQIEDMFKYTKQHPYNILVGDLNAEPEDSELEPLFKWYDDAWNFISEESGYTFPTDEPVKRIDYILTSPRIEPTTAEVLDSSASDHLPVVTELTFSKENSESLHDMIKLAEKLEQTDHFSDNQSYRSISTHLTTLEHYEKEEKFEKVIKHLNGLKNLLDYQKENDLISQRAYTELYTDADYLIEKWDTNPEDEQAANEVKRMIYNLPKASELTLEDKEAVEEVRQAYEELSDKAKKLVTSISQLEIREKRLAELVIDAITLSPTPQSLNFEKELFSISSKVHLISNDEADAAAKNVVEDALKEIGVEEVVTQLPDESVSDTSMVIRLGNVSDDPEILDALDDLGINETEINTEGYILASNADQKQVVLAGADDSGEFYAAQTFRQIIEQIESKSFPVVEIHDWPDMQKRGIIEGFYGEPWSHEDRLNQINFYGKNKMNTYVYAPKDDPYHLNKWREPYPEDRFNELKDLIQESKKSHVDFVFALSPGSSVCYSGEEDFELLMNKMQDVYDIGVRDFAIFFDDISSGLKCDQDKEKFGDEENPAAAAQAHLLNRFQEEFIENNKDTGRLITVPTEYSGLEDTVYKQKFGELVDSQIIIDWTGPAVVSPEITGEEATEARDIFNHDLLIWDNYPVNDFETSRLFLAPFNNRSADLSEHGVVGITANPMVQAEASKIALYTVADYVWNPAEYNPENSWENSLNDFAKDASEILKVFAENSYSSAINDDKGSPTLQRLIDNFWEAYETNDFEAEADELFEYFELIEGIPAQLQEKLENKKFLDETSAWQKKFEIQGKAGQKAVKLLIALKQDDEATIEKLREDLEEIFENDTITLELEEPHVATKGLDGTNRFRDASELILYTPEYGEKTGTNPYGYEITVIDDEVVEMGGNNSTIPEDGYVLSLHVSNWLEDNAIIGAKVSIENDEVTLTIPEGTHVIPNKKVMAPDVFDPFVEEVLEIYSEY